MLRLFRAKPADVAEEKTSSTWTEYFTKQVTSRLNFRGAAKRLEQALFVSSYLLLPIQAMAKTCFEGNGEYGAQHDYTLRCGKGEKALFALLQANCGVFQDTANDCANFFVNTVNACSGYIAGAMCELTYHEVVNDLPDPCIINMVQTNCTNGFGTDEDIAIVSFAGAGGLCLLSCLAYLFLRCKRQRDMAAELAPGNDIDLDNRDAENPDFAYRLAVG